MKIIFPLHTLKTKTFGPITAFSYKRVISRRVTWWTGLALFRHLTFWHTHFISVDVLACVLIGPLDVPAHGHIPTKEYFGNMDVLAWGHRTLRRWDISSQGYFDAGRFSTGAHFGDSQLT